MFHDLFKLRTIFNVDTCQKFKPAQVPTLDFQQFFFQKHAKGHQIIPEICNKAVFRLENSVDLGEDVKHEVCEFEVGHDEGVFKGSEHILDLSKGVLGRCNVPSPFLTVLVRVQKRIDLFGLVEQSRERIPVEEPSRFRWQWDFFLGKSGLALTKAV